MTFPNRNWAPPVAPQPPQKPQQPCGLCGKVREQFHRIKDHITGKN